MHEYKIIVADDEWTIRNGLVNSVDWAKMGFRVVADVMDGQDILDYLKDHEVDVVFSDVQMCQVSGLTVARWVYENRPDVKMVLISGYKEFDYIKEAMACKVVDYVLKPIDLMALEETFHKVKKELDERKTGNRMYLWLDCLEDTACQAVLMLEGGLLESVLNGEIKKTEATMQCWKEAMQEVKFEYIPQLVLHLMELFFKRVEKEKIALENYGEKFQVFQKIRELSEVELLKYIQGVLWETAGQIARKKSTDSSEVVKKAGQYIESHLAEDFGVEEVADYMYLSRSHLSREFKAQMGISIIDYIIQRRMERAKEMVREGKLSADEIAAAVGYADSRYFQRSFKKYTGHSIREYRNLQRYTL